MMNITPKEFKKGDKFLMVTTGDIWTLRGFRALDGHISPILICGAIPSCTYSPTQPNLVPVGRRPTKVQIEAVWQVLNK